MNNYTATWHYSDGTFIDEITTKNFKTTFTYIMRWIKARAHFGIYMDEGYTSKVTFTRNGEPLHYELLICHPTDKVKFTDMFLKVKGLPHYVTTVYMK